MTNGSKIENEVEAAINKWIEDLSSNLIRNLSALCSMLVDKHSEGAEPITKPTLIVWVDGVELEMFGMHLGAFVRFGDDIEKIHGDELCIEFNAGLTFAALAGAIASMHKTLSSRDTIRGLISAARRRMMTNNHGVAA